MILFVGRAAVSEEITAWVSQETGMELQVAASLEAASRLLRTTKCRVAVIDVGLLETDPKGIDLLLSEDVATLPVFPNFAVCGPERLVCEIKAALRRGEQVSRGAADGARRELRINLKNSVTAFLLNCDLTIQVPDLPQEAVRKLQLLHHLATKMRDDLEIEAGQAASA